MLSQSGMITLWIGIVVYVGVLIGIGFWSSRKVKGMNDFLVAGRRLPLWMATATLLATWFGAGSSMGVAATVYTDGIGGVLADPFGASISLVLAGIFIVGLLRRLKCLTVTDIVERKYGKWAGVYTSLWMIPVYIGWLGAQMLGIGTILHILTGMDALWGTLIGAAVVLIYTFAGGMWAVTLTDVVQVSLIVIGLFVIVPGAVFEAGGWSEMTSRLSAADLSIGMRHALDPATGEPVPFVFSDYIYYIGSWIVMGLGCMVGQDLIQRSLASRNEKIAVSSAVMSGFFYAAIGLVPITIGFAARTVLTNHGITPESMGVDNLENQVLPRMAIIILGNIHPIVLTVFLAALISAIMSSADSSLLGRVVAALQQRDRFDLAAAQRPEAAGPDPGGHGCPDLHRAAAGDLGQKHLQPDDQQLGVAAGRDLHSGRDGALCAEGKQERGVGCNGRLHRRLARLRFRRFERDRAELHRTYEHRPRPQPDGRCGLRLCRRRRRFHLLLPRRAGAALGARPAGRGGRVG